MSSQSEHIIHPFILLFMGIGLGALTTIFLLRNSPIFNAVVSPPFAEQNDDLDRQPAQPLFSMYGVVKTGEQLGRNYCGEGLYLVSEMSNGLETTTQTLLLKVRTLDGQSALFAEQSFIDQRASVTADEELPTITCKALTCGCEQALYISTAMIE